MVDSTHLGLRHLQRSQGRQLVPDQGMPQLVRVRMSERGMTPACSDRRVLSRCRVHEECGDRWRQERRLLGMTPMCPYGACYKGQHEMRCWLQQ
jgi:hypothetical protein